MSVTYIAHSSRPARGRPHYWTFLGKYLVPAILTSTSIIAYVTAAVYTGQYAQLQFEGVMGLLQRSVALGMVAIGQGFVILAGSIDLSVANLVSLSSVLGAYFMQGELSGVSFAVTMVLIIAAGVGALNGILISKMRVNPLIATLGVSLILQGVLSVAFTRLQGSVPPHFQSVAYGNWNGIPFALIALGIIASLAVFILKRTVAGARLYAVGGNPESARLAGIHTTKVLIGAHAAAGFMCGLAGIYLISWLGAGTPWVGRDGGYDLDSIAAVVIGGTLLSGGKGDVIGTLAGVFTFATIDAVFNMLQIDPFLSQVLRGVLVVAAVGVYTFRNKGFIA